MTLIAQPLGSGPGWSSAVMTCSAGPADPRFEEQHAGVSIAVVLEGSFGYRNRCGMSILVPGAILLGNPGDCYECGHQHSRGDRCLAFHFEPAVQEAVVAALPGARPLRFKLAAFAPRQCGAGLLPHADQVVENPQQIEAFAFQLLETVMSRHADCRGLVSASNAARARNTRCVQELVHWLMSNYQQPLSLTTLAQHVALSPAHLLREFKRITGTTPHQFMLAQRMRQAAQRLRDGDESVLQIALDAGFGDISEFNRRFRRELGTTPSGFRTSPGQPCKPAAGAVATST